MTAMEQAAATGLQPKDYKSDYKPIWCPGCGDYSVLTSITKALSVLGVARENAAVVSGIGCSSRIPAYTSLYGFHGVHGRALALATGLKIARPDLTVLVTGGDGDGFSIGGNHFLHDSRRTSTNLRGDGQPSHGIPRVGLSDRRRNGRQQADPARHGVSRQPWRWRWPPGPTLRPGLCRRSQRGGPPDRRGRPASRLLVHPVLSQCVTYRAEQPNGARGASIGQGADRQRGPASRRILDDDGFTTGIFYLGSRPPYQPVTAVDRTLTDIEQRFAI